MSYIYKSINKIPYNQRILLKCLGFTHSFNKYLLSTYHVPKYQIYALKISFGYFVRKDKVTCDLYARRFTEEKKQHPN